MDVDDRGAGAGCCDRVVGDLFGCDGNVLALAGGVSGTGDGAGEDDLAVHDDSLDRSVLVAGIEVVSGGRSGVVDRAVVVGVAGAGDGCLIERSR